MDLQELEKQIITLEADQTLSQTAVVLGSIPQLKQDMAVIKLQLDNLG